jgi:hypothetical protein
MCCRPHGNNNRRALSASLRPSDRKVGSPKNCSRAHSLHERESCRALLQLHIAQKLQFHTTAHSVKRSHDFELGVKPRHVALRRKVNVEFQNVP